MFHSWEEIESFKEPQDVQDDQEFKELETEDVMFLNLERIYSIFNTHDR